jgi:hypothetical protein
VDYPVRVADPIPFTRLHRLGAGAGGEVWYAEHEGEKLAVKVVAAGRNLSAEIGALARLRHPNVPRLVAADREATWMARSFVSGARLTSWAHGRPLRERLDVLARVAETLVAVHGAGVLHGDLSPANILVDEEGQPHLLDVGADTRGGALGWMAPERLRGEGPSVPSEVYGLGALLYAVCTGRPPYERSGTLALGYASGASLPGPIPSVAPDVPSDVAELALTALAWRPSARPPSARAFLELLQRARPDLPLQVVVGMEEERERLRRIVVDVLRGESALVIVHGPPGSGRRTLVEEVALRAAAEGLAVHRYALDAAALGLLRASDSDVLLIDADGATKAELQEVLEVATEAGLVLVRASVPVRVLARRGAVHVRPVPFTRSEVAVLSAALGLGVDRVQRAWERSRGNPAVTVALLHGHVPLPELTPAQARLLGRLEEGPARLPELATLLDATEHQTLDLLEPLMESGAVWSGPEGAELFGSRTL